MLSNKTYGLGFYKYTGSELNPYRAWLPADKVVSDVSIGLSSGTKGIRFIFGDDEDLSTGLEEVLYGRYDGMGDDKLYNLSGQRVSKVGAKGIYISRDKGKVVIRK